MHSCRPAHESPADFALVSTCLAQERFYFGDAVLPLFESGVPLLLERLRALPDKENVSAPSNSNSCSRQ